MPKYLVFTDLQATEGHQMCFTQPDIPLQRYRVDKFLEDIDALCGEHRVDGLIDLGDASDDRSALQLPTIDQISRLGHDSRGWIKLIGNHEQYRRDQSIHTGALYKTWNVVAGRQVFDVEGCRVITAAFTENLKELNEWLLSTIIKTPKDTPIVVLGHWDVQGAMTSGGTQLNGIPVDTLDRAQVTLLGHIHKPQQLGERIYYVGSPFQQDYGEAGEHKRVGLLELEAGEVSLSWVSMEDYPTYTTITVEDYAKKAASFRAEDRVTVLINSPEEAIKLEKLKPKFVTKKLTYGEKLAINARVSVANLVVTPRELLKTYTLRQPIQLNGLLSEEDLVQAGLELFEAV